MWTEATTMNSTPVVIPNVAVTTHTGSINVYGSGGYGYGTYSGTSTTVGPPHRYSCASASPDGHGRGKPAFVVDLSKKPAQLSVAGKTLTILQADNSKLVYVLSE